MNQVVSLKQIRNQLSDLVSRVAYGDQKIVITKNGKPTAALVSYEDYEKMMNPAKRFTDKEWKKGFELMDKMRENTKNYSQEEVELAIKEAIADVRKEKHVSSRS